MKPILAYWDIRGRANAIRMLLYYKGVDFEDKRYTNHEEWFQKDKLQLPLDFPNLPYYIDGDIKLTQTRAILQHVGRKYGLGGKTEEETARIEMLSEQFVDLLLCLVGIAYPGDIPNKEEVYLIKKEQYLATLEEKLTAFSKYLQDADWFSGSYLTYLDFFAYDTLDFQRVLFNPKHINKFPNLVKFLERIENLKGVKEYLASPQLFKRLPIFGPFAMFGQTEDYKYSD